jgi:hypothetical protein
MADAIPGTATMAARVASMAPTLIASIRIEESQLRRCRYRTIPAPAAHRDHVRRDLWHFNEYVRFNQER